MTNKKFKVVGRSKVMDVEVDVIDICKALDLYDYLRYNDGTYDTVYIMSNETGELYKTFNRSRTSGGIEVREWVAL